MIFQRESNWFDLQIDVVGIFKLKGHGNEGWSMAIHWDDSSFGRSGNLVLVA